MISKVWYNGNKKTLKKKNTKVIKNFYLAQIYRQVKV